MDKPLSPLSISTLNNLVDDRLLARFSERLGLIDYIRWESDDSQQVAENIRPPLVNGTSAAAQIP
jgi:hypothetical protein